MIRTRDFVLFVIAVTFLSIGIGGTLIHDIWTNDSREAAPVDLVDGGVPPSVISELSEDDREINLTRLREKIAKGEGIIASAPPILISVDTATSSSDDENSNSHAPILCSSWSDQEALINNWQNGRVQVRNIEGARLFYTEATNIDGTVTERPLLQLATNQIRQSQNSCLNGSVSGVTVSGDLIINDRASRFVGLSESVLIGYALDGFPIYGHKADVSALDVCGGMSDTAGYRYYLRNDENSVINCFAGQPAKFFQ